LKYWKEVTVVLRGGLRNLALGVKKWGEVIDQVKEVIFMGGVVEGEGNVRGVGEFNRYGDGEGGKLVVEGGLA
uniref:nucleoside hydrolase n=1 Tax=Bacillus altitudinis TaxID=293387 RepID=UPI001F3D5201